MSIVKTVLFFVGAISLSLFVSFVVPKTVEAAVGSGAASSGGAANCNGGGIRNCPWTTNGQGWYQFGVGDPNAPRGNSYWDTANATCSAEGASHVVAYVVHVGQRNLSQAWIYKFRWSWESGGPYVGNISVDDAQAKFNSVPDKQGYTFGVDVGWFCYNDRTRWYIDGRSYIQNNPVANKSAAVAGTIAALPGDRLNWYHDLRNTGPQNMDRDIYFNIDRTGFSNGWNNIKAPNTTARGANGSLFVYEYAQFPSEPWRPASPYTLYDVTQNDVGNTLCARISWQQVNWENGGWGSSGFACANIPYSYELVPTITNVTDGQVVERGQGDFAVRGHVQNTGRTKSRPNAQWQLTQVKFSPTATITNKAGGTTNRDPCAYFTGAQTCGSIQSGTEGGGYGHNGGNSYNGNGRIGEDPVGTRVCYAMSVRPHSSGSGDWRHSALHCTRIGKTPKVNVVGGDLLVGRTIAGVTVAPLGRVITSTSPNTTGIYGSWGEYGIASRGPVNGMASGSGYVGGDALNLNLLTFANTGHTSATCATSNGCYTHGKSLLPDLSARFRVSEDSPVATSGSLTGRASGVYRGSGPINIAASTIGAGRSIVINASTSDVTISGNIQYASGVASVAELPQLVIIARSITINENVTNVDAWLVAPGTVGSSGATVNGVIRTCNRTPSEINDTVCDDKLTVNGPIITNRLVMLRTDGADPGEGAGAPAEVFNFRPDAYLWALRQAETGGRVTTVSTKELPPRY